MKTAPAVVDPPPETHAPDCDGRCPRWLAAGVPGCVPYPCRCAQTKMNGPEWGRERCWWVVKATGRITSRCPCWGRERIDGLPGSCCAHHSANPRYAEPVAEPVAEFEMSPGWAGWHAPHERADWSEQDAVERGAAPVDAGLLDWSHLDVPTRDPEIEYPVYVRRWTHAELHCDCVTPFDLDKRVTGWHCSQDQCHQNFRSYQVGSMHRRLWTEPCRPPATLVDVDTGKPLMYQGADGVWGPLYPTAD